MRRCRSRSLQEEMPFVTALQIPPSGMRLASTASACTPRARCRDEGLTALPTQWSFAEISEETRRPSTARIGRVPLSWHIAETGEKAREEAGKKGPMRHHNEYIVGTLQRPGAASRTSRPPKRSTRPGSPGSAATIGTPDDLVETIKNVIKMSAVSVLSSASPMTGPTSSTFALGDGRALRHPRESTVTL